MLSSPQVICIQMLAQLAFPIRDKRPKTKKKEEKKTAFLFLKLVINILDLFAVCFKS
jgi:hypothetical protein